MSLHVHYVQEHTLHMLTRIACSSSQGYNGDLTELEKLRLTLQYYVNSIGAQNYTTQFDPLLYK